MMKISVIIPVFNAGLYLSSCLESILCQSFSDFEVICVDDCSADNSCEIVESYAGKDNRIKLIKLSVNAGGGAARNIGLAHASGEFVYFPDADDYLAKDLFEKNIEVIEAYAADMVIFRAYNDNVKDNNVEVINYAFQKDNFYNSVISYRSNPVKIFNSFQNWAWNKFFRRSFIDKHGLCFQELRRTNDLLFTCSALVCADRIVLLDDVLYYYRTGMSTNCQATNYLSPLDFYEAFKALYVFLQSRGIYDEVAVSYCNHFMESCISNILSLRNNMDAAIYVYEMIKFRGLAECGILRQLENGGFDLAHKALDFVNGNALDYFQLGSAEPLLLKNSSLYYVDSFADLNDYLHNCTKVSLYGAGKIGFNLHRYIDDYLPDLIIESVFVSDSSGKFDLLGTEIVEYSAGKLPKNFPVVICVIPLYRNQILKAIDDGFFKNVVVLSDSVCSYILDKLC